MNITSDQISEYNEQGYLIIKNCFDKNELIHLRAATVHCLSDYNDPSLVMEENKKAVRGIHGSHLKNELLSSLSKNYRLVNPVMSLLKQQVYVQQFKINVKAAFAGDLWEWHQDFTFFHNEDHIEEPKLITVAIFLDAVTEFNGPLMLIPRSHQQDFLGANKNNFEEYDKQSSWLSNMTAKLRYSVDQSTVAQLVEKNGLIAPKGDSGTVLFFHCNLFHCSTTNMSPFDRKIIFITYNTIDNFPINTANCRPEFLASRNFKPIKPCMADLK